MKRPAGMEPPLPGESFLQEGGRSAQHVQLELLDPGEQRRTLLLHALHGAGSQGRGGLWVIKTSLELKFGWQFGMEALQATKTNCAHTAIVRSTGDIPGITCWSSIDELQRCAPYPHNQ